MKRLLVNPIEIWPFQADAGISVRLTQHIQQCGWEGIPPVPIFEIPNDIPREHNYILMDGNHRRNVALELGLELPCALYEIGERIDTARESLAPFRHSTDARIYQKLLAAYQIREDLHRLSTERLQESR